MQKRMTFFKILILIRVDILVPLSHFMRWSMNLVLIIEGYVYLILLEFDVFS
jgi:hypothetical protein